MNNEIKIPQTVQEVLDVLQRNGQEAYIVGGCVRDSIMGKEPKDWDITTSATPEEIKSYFPRTVDTGIKHGTVTVLHNREPIEVTTFRLDGLYEDHRRPREVYFTKSLQEDVARRDFTVNAMAYSYQTGLVDYFEGQKDLQGRQIRCVGRAEDRFEEDALRMMRAVRFAAVLNFTIEDLTSAAIFAKRDLIRAVSQERIRIEFIKTLDSANPEYLAYFARYGLSAYFLPEIVLPEDFEDLFYRVLRVLPAGYSRLAFLMARMGVGEVSARAVKGVLKRMTFDNRTIQVVCGVVACAVVPLEGSAYCFRKFLSQWGEEVVRVILDWAYATGSMERLAGQRLLEDSLDKPLRISDLAINGKDLMALGVAQGERIGYILECMLDFVLQNPLLNTREDLIQIAREYCEE